MKALHAIKRKFVNLACKSIPGAADVINYIHLHRNRQRSVRMLEIGPGPERIHGFETLNIVRSTDEDYISDASGNLFFNEGEFDLIYASHVLEHVPWYKTDAALREWIRVLKPGGTLELWVPDGLKICRTLVEFEDSGVDQTSLDGWYRFNPDKDPCVWANGRIFTYGDGSGVGDHPNWHRTIFTPRYLKKVLLQAGYVDVQLLGREAVRGSDHGWINLGMKAYKARE